MSAPGLFTSTDQAVKVINDPAVRKLMFGLGANKGLEGVALAPIGPSSTAMRKEVKHLAEFKGTKIRVLASPFQLELIRRMDASPVAMTLGDVLPALQQGAIDGALATITVFTTFQYVDVAKYVIETDQPYLNSIVVMSKKWLATLPPDLQKIVRDDAGKVSQEIVPFVKEFFAKQYDIWKGKGGVLIKLPADGAGRHDQEGLQHRRGSVEGQSGAEQGREAGVRIGEAKQIDRMRTPGDIVIRRRPMNAVPGGRADCRDGWQRGAFNRGTWDDRHRVAGRARARRRSPRAGRRAAGA